MRGAANGRSGKANQPPGPNLSGTNLERAGDYNQRVMLQAIRVNGPITRADLAGMTGLTAPTIANITKRLQTQGLIAEAGRLQGARGQPAMQLTVNPDGAFSVGVNIDRDHMTVVALDLEGRVRARASQEVSFAPPSEVVGFFRAQLKALFGRGGVPRARVIGVGVAAPDDLGNVALPHRPAGYEVWDRTDIAKLFSDALSLPVYVENDAVAAAIGELQFGHGLKAPSFFYILISAGLGGALVIDGVTYRGANGRSGELGFLPLRSKNGRALQDEVSLSAIYARLDQAGIQAFTPEALTTLSPAGAALVAAWIEEAGEFLAEPLTAINCLINPDAVFLGGRLPAPMVDALVQNVSARLARRKAEIPVIAPVRRAAMAADAPAIGAAILPFQARLFPSRAALMKTVGP
ncbi:MAG TPA: ROK family transcriptional regulator [Caulobacterales bacterium]|nr:ROK family transcriptional regulator [Caulobacterales bacterium]